MVGLPCAGKTTLARKFEKERRALRLTPDEWMIPLFEDAEADGKRDVLEGRFVSLAACALRGGLDVILDFGVWGRDERSGLRWMAQEIKVDFELVYLPIDEVEQQRRVLARLAAEPASTFAMTPDDLTGFRRLFQVPDENELRGTRIEPPPLGYSTWPEWIAERWPTSTW